MRISESVTGEIPRLAAMIVGELLGTQPISDLRPNADQVRCLFEYGRNHRLLPLIVERLRRARIDAETSALVQSARQALVGSSLALAAEHDRLLALFSANSLDVRSYKGPDLARRLWGDVAMRAMGDLDFLVRPRDVIRAHDLLIEHGYHPKVHVGPNQWRPFIRYEHDRAYVRADDGMVVELHWKYFDRYIAFELTEEEVWGGDAGNDPEIDLVVLSLHGAKHAWTSAGWIVDIAAMLIREPPNESILSGLARLTGTSRALTLALALASGYTGLKLEKPLAERIARDRAARELCNTTLKGPISRPRTTADTVDDPSFYLQTRERFVDRFHYHWYWIFTPNIDDQNVLNAPAWLAWLNYPVRVVRLLMKRRQRARAKV